jgi:hypothetical protein
VILVIVGNHQVVKIIESVGRKSVFGIPPYKWNFKEYRIHQYVYPVEANKKRSMAKPDDAIIFMRLKCGII